MQKRFVFLAILALALVLTAEKGHAADTRTVDTASPQEVVDGMANKLVRGVANIATGWLELPKQIYLTCKEEGAAKCVTVGPIKGIGMTLVRTASGVGETATFFLAYPGFYDPYLDPAYAWQKE
ncbi:exosortase system-associated protein, TIGR04073 family [Geomonas sp. Red69]|uniref:exosortase system-associated protein, TIGR04073 family n=1 Tax=Geomonas diazotrophica TaxID=2843197 RepID=UPI001C11561C|nr:MULTISPECIES: exosortase system-associated protein, TIGR04073 family [Geomonas]MBU5635420.1 exosortase system-associated protein, TIGR04073 family [Geomonas diazotrophica]QXE88959.1 exosortase system-associated protein, TIGR04073 family [Geomonas nitrogeniifigens]